MFFFNIVWCDIGAVLKFHLCVFLVYLRHNTYTFLWEFLVMGNRRLWHSTIHCGVQPQNKLCSSGGTEVLCPSATPPPLETLFRIWQNIGIYSEVISKIMMEQTLKKNIKLLLIFIFLYGISNKASAPRLVLVRTAIPVKDHFLT